MHVQSYLFFDGRCDEAIEFYKKTLGAKVDMLMRFKRSGYQPKRTIKLALTCGEEATNAFNGAQWLAKNRPELIAAAKAERGEVVEEEE